MPLPTGSSLTGPAPAPRNLADLVRRAAQQHGDRPALLHPGVGTPLGDPSAAGSTTWARLEQLVERAATSLAGQGLGPGDRLAVMLPNVPLFPVVYFGALRAGLVVVPLDVRSTAAEVRHLLDDSGARAAVVAQEVASVLLQVSPRTAMERVWVTGSDAPAGAEPFDDLLASGDPGGDGPDGPDEADPPRAAAGEDTAVIAYTSGTSGRPKGAMLSHRALLADLDNVGRIEPALAGPGDVVLLVLPMTHIYGLNTGLGLVAATGSTGLLVEHYDPVGTLEAVRVHGVTVVLGVPPMFTTWVGLDGLTESFTGVRIALCGAAPMPSGPARRLLEVTGRPLFEAYGLTETGPSVASALMSEVPRPGSVGRPVPGVEVLLVDPSGAEVDEDDPGEVCVRGANLFSGYWPDRTDGPDADGWWATGDVAVRDAAGDLTLVDRRRELIIVSGFNVYPREVEDALLTHPDVREAAVLGIPHPYSGEAVRALVVVRPGSGLTAEALMAHARGLLARFKCPTSIEVVPALPHSATGKISKARLRDDLAGPGARDAARD